MGMTAAHAAIAVQKRQKDNTDNKGSTAQMCMSGALSIFLNRIKPMQAVGWLSKRFLRDGKYISAVNAAEGR